MRNQRGGTFADLVVALTLIILLLPVTASVATRSRETSNRVRCASNLKQIGQAILLYSNENRNHYPRTRYRAETADAPTAWSGSGSTSPFAADGPAINDVTAAYRLLLATQDLIPDVFLCPTSGAGDPAFARARFKVSHANFLDERELSYSFANPYPTAAVRDAGYKLTNAISAEFAVAGDVNPGIVPPDSDVAAVASTASARDTRRGNSPNHDRDGQNFLYGDGHVEFQQSPYAGLARDNVYTFGRRDEPKTHGVFGAPTHAGDSVLLPTVNPATWKLPRPATPSPRGNAIWVALLVLAAIVGAIGWLRRDRGLRPPAAPLAS
jgi:prepilin-type processing-associated H-X9-DG protein